MFNPAALQSEQLFVDYPIDTVYEAFIKLSEVCRKFRFKDFNDKLYRVC